MIKIITDSSSDITPLRAKELGVEVVPLKIIFGETSYRDGVDISVDEFYEKLASYEALPTTSQPSPEDFLVIFEDAKAKGDTVIAITLSSKLSGTCQSAIIAKGLADYENIHIVDSLTAIGGVQMLVHEALRMVAEQVEVADIVARLNDIAPRIIILAVIDTLENLYKGGRLSRAAKIAGSLLSFKPLITVDDGIINLKGKARGTKKAMALLCDEMDKLPDVDTSVPYYFGYTHVEAPSLVMKSIVSERYNIEIDENNVTCIGATIGTHIGPGGCAIIYLRK